MSRNPIDPRPGPQAGPDSDAGGLFASAFQHAPIGMAVTTPEGAVLDVNPAFCRMLGRGRDDLLGAAIGDLTHPAEREAVASLLRRLGSGEQESAELEWRWLPGEGAGEPPVRLARVAISAAAGPGGGHLVLQAQDITAERAAEQARSAAEQRFRAFIEEVPAAIFLVPMDKAGAPAYISPQIERITGYTPDDLMTDRDFLLPLVHADDRAAFVAENERSDATLEPFAGEFRLRHREGGWVWVSLHATVTRSPGGVPTGWQGVIVDITSARSAQDRLRAAQRMYGALVSTIPAITYRCAPDALGTSRFEYLSPQAALLLGFDLDTLLAPGTMHGLMHPDDLPSVLADAAGAMTTGQAVSLYRIRSADGRWHWLRDETVLIRDEFGAPLSWHGVAFDITAEKEAAARVSAAEARYHAIVDHIPAFTYVMHPGAIRSWRFAYLSPKLEAILGYPPSSFPRAGDRQDEFFDRLIHPDDLSVMNSAIEEQVAKGRDRIVDFYRLRAADGGWRWIRDEAVLIRDDAGEPLYWHAAGLDVTAEREAERRVAEAVTRYRGLVDNLPAAVLLTRSADDDRIAYASPGAEDLFGCEAGAITSDPGFITRNTHPEDRERVAAALAAAFASRGPWTGELRVRGAGDGWIWVRAELRLVLDDEGRPLHWQALLLDITSQKAAEAALAERERLFASAFEAGPVGVAVVGPDARIIDANPVLCAMLGMTREDLAGRTYEHITEEGGIAANAEAFARLREGLDDRFTLIKHYRRADGSVFAGRLNVAAVRDETGRLVRAISQIEDISAQEAARQDLVLSEQRFRALVQHMPDAIVLTDVDGIIRWTTPSAETLFATPQEELIGQRGGAWVHPDDVAGLTMLGMEAMKRPGEAATGEFRMRGAGGEWRWVQVFFTDHLHTPGIEGLISNLRDVTDRKQAELAMAEAHRLQGKALADLRDTNQARGDFLAFLDHDFRTPLTGISGYAQLLAQGSNSDEDVRRFSGIILRESGRLSRMVADLLLVDRAEGGGLSLEREPAPLAAIVQDRIAVMATAWPDREIAAAIGEGFTVDGDVRLLGTAVEALLDNALRYSGAGAAVAVEARRDEGMVRLTVRDAGFGIPEEHLDRVFDRFHRVRDGRARFIPGNGLGLTVARAIVTLHGGRAWAESTPGEGSAFHLLLPGA
ncbi:MAG: PAS domain S-box protein [Chloroflexota bacterium]